MLTLLDLKQIMGKPQEKYPPSAKYLESQETGIVKKKMGMEAQLTVYGNGYAVYRIKDRSTVFSIHSCGDYVYRSCGKYVRIREDVFDGLEWYIRLVLEGEDRLFHNREVQEREKNVSYHSVSEEWKIMECRDVSPLEQIIKKETAEELLNILTERQRDVICRLYYREKTQKEISEELGISAPAVSRILSQAVRRIQRKRNRKCTENGKEGVNSHAR